MDSQIYSGGGEGLGVGLIKLTDEQSESFNFLIEMFSE